jgi:uncharacterized protein YggL (DUF469 family)
MANRSRRLRKKLRVDEFQEMGFDISFNFPVGTAEETIDAVVDALIDEVIEPRKLAFAGSGHLAWEGMICTQQLGKCTDEDRSAVQTWLQGKGWRPWWSPSCSISGTASRPDI